MIGKSLQHLCSYPQDISIMIFTPIYLYLALFKGDFQGNIFEEFILIPLAVYIGAPLVKEVFFHPERAKSKGIETKKLIKTVAD